MRVNLIDALIALAGGAVAWSVLFRKNLLIRRILPLSGGGMRDAVGDHNDRLYHSTP